MKNIYIVDEYASSKINGIGTYIRELIYCLKKTGVNICLIACCHESKTFKIVVQDGIKQIQFPAVFDIYSKNCNVIDKFFRLYIKDSKENIFLFNHTPCESLLKIVKASFPLSKIIFTIHDMTWTGALLGDKAKLKKYTIAENHQLFEKEHPDLLPNFNEEKRMFETVHRIVALAPETLELLQNVYQIDKDKISLIPNGLQDECAGIAKEDIKQLKEKLLIPLHEKVIVFAGRVLNVKGIFQILNSLKKVVKTYPNFRLIVVGTIFNAKKIMDHAGEIASKIIFTGQIPKNRLKEWYQIADVGVLASYWEQSSYTGIEMMMYGLPVVASDGFCVGDMFIDNVNAKVARIGDRNHPVIFENNLSEIFLELLQSDELCKKLGKNGRKIYEAKYKIEYMKDGYQKLFLSLHKMKQKYSELAIGD